MLINFCIFSLVFQILILAFHVNVFKLVVMVGTFALAMAFSANDLVNFIGIPLAGLNAFEFANATADPLNATMEALKQPVHTKTYQLLIAGIIMVLTLWFSKKTRTVSQTELSLGRQDEGMERFGASTLSRIIVTNGLRIVPGDQCRPPDFFQAKDCQATWTRAHTG